MSVRNQWFYRRGTLARGTWESVVDSAIDGWRHTGLRIAVLANGDLDLAAADVERIVIPLSGEFRVRHDETMTVLDGREGVFAGATDVLYTGAGTRLTISGNGRVAVAEAPTSVRKPSRYLAREEVPVEVRGAGRDTRPRQRSAHSQLSAAVTAAKASTVSTLIHINSDPHLYAPTARAGGTYQWRRSPAWTAPGRRTPTTSSSAKSSDPCWADLSRKQTRNHPHEEGRR
jgi:5-deoxy-D-glucuronate isomerase